ncbi:hypothetical protein BJY21_002068 [Kineosphaera limosa]|uniref:Heparinase II/III-like C-terminal domain-containing protein n=1 Tax=Kineosphaera limosa NBRC 100340 TaxID=1184609 RepID=K6W6V2_9MICO|nr:heparinase II/III family protein [Kineosphaera limosa]NYE00884.1 hypothetical protein [Kineosphaera limosa]GAB94920.1 hypothetical protein KILIM_014_00560 [Kineosphaera limosa NBRC 100340]
MPRVRVLAAAAACLAVPILVTTLFSSGAPPQAPPSQLVAENPCPRTEVDPLGLNRQVTSRCDRTSEEPVRDDAPIHVTLDSGPSFTLGAEPWRRGGQLSSDPTWQMTMFSLDWVPPLVRRAISDSQDEVKERLLATVTRFYAENPDPGNNDRGWDEGTSLRRLEALSCLYSMTSDRRLIPAMEAEAGVLFSDRYYGPPNHPVHNHGLMANVRLIEAGRQIGRDDWVRDATARLKDEMPEAFSTSGTTLEQSSGYQIINANMWAGAGRMVAAADPDDPFLTLLGETVTRARGVAAWLTEPDGRIVQIGDANRVKGTATDCSAPGLFRDDEAGLVVGRWSWTDPKTTYFTLRYGPPRRSHGHHDQGSLTWTAGGHRVLVGSGFFGYDQKDPLVVWGFSPAAANVARPPGAAPTRKDGFILVDEAQDAAGRTLTLTGSPYGAQQRRIVHIDPGRAGVSTATITDDLPSGAESPLEQRWLLDPDWTAAKQLAPGRWSLTHKSGAQLVVDSPGATIAAVRGSSDPIGGWVFPHRGQKQPAYQLTITGPGLVRTTFRLTTEKPAPSGSATPSVDPTASSHADAAQAAP